jgi:uncharacterized membrane protein
MEFSTGQIGWPWLAAGWAGALAALAAAVRGAPWHRLAAGGMQHAVGAACVALMVLWSIRAGFAPALGYHFFGVTTLTLMFGWQLALVAGVPVLVAGGLLGNGDWGALGLNLLTLFALPAGVTWGLLALARRRLPRNFFVFIYVNAYLGAACAMVAVTLVMSGILLAAGAVEPGASWRDYVGFLPLLALAEGFINGMTTTVLVATRPALVWTFDDASYLRG